MSIVGLQCVIVYDKKIAMRSIATSKFISKKNYSQRMVSRKRTYCLSYVPGRIKITPIQKQNY